MKVRDAKNWTAICFKDRVIVKNDLKIMNKEQIQYLMNLNVEVVKGTRYRVIE